LRQAGRIGSQVALDRADQQLRQSIVGSPAADYRARVFELGEALFQSIRMQLSVPKYRAIQAERGANLDTIDLPLNNRVWLWKRFDEIRKLDDEANRLAEIEGIVERTNPGPGGFYDDLGNLTQQPHLVRHRPYREDPAHLVNPLIGFGNWGNYLETPVSWWNHAESLHEAPLQLRYKGLDPEAHYRLRVVYGGDSTRHRIRLTADDDYEIHPFRAKEVPFGPVEFAVPAAATTDGTLTLTWTREPGAGGNGRGCQVSEVWLVKQAAK
jgi:hypothetical protein